MSWKKMFRCVSLGATFAALLGAEPALRVPDLKIGRDLEAPAKVTLADPAPDEGLDVTVRSSDPARLVISTAADQPGSASVVVKVRGGALESREFWLQGRADSGQVAYTAAAGKDKSGTATVTLSPSTIVIIGPLKAPRFLAATGGDERKVTIYSARLDSPGGEPQEQPIGGVSVPITISNSNPAAGKITDANMVMTSGMSSLRLLFQPAGDGETVLTPQIPEHFTASTKYASVSALVRKPGIALSDDLRVGKDLEVAGVVGLGAMPPASGVEVTITSEDPSKLLVSPSDKTVGQKTIKITIPVSQTVGRYYLQALDQSGTVSVTATAPGFRTRTADVTLTPAGVVITPVHQGPPDEAQVLRKEPPDGVHKFFVDLAREDQMNLVVWTVQLDPITHRSADITVQPLRAGVDLEVELTNSHPEIAKVPANLKITPGSDHTIAQFKAASAGSTEVDVVTPKGFTASANSTKVIGYVKKSTSTP